MTVKKHFIIGLGASAGGLEALSYFLESFENTKSDFSIIIAQHLSPTSKSMLVDILTRKTQLPVIFAKNKTLLERGKIYVTPPDENITVQGEKLVLQKAPEDQVSPRPSIDVLFISMAENLRERAIAVIFSGTGKDGSLGISKVMEEGGLTIVQEPDSAKFPSMPYSATQIMKPDYIIPSPDIGKLLSGDLSSLMAKRVRVEREQSRPKEIKDLDDFIVRMKKNLELISKIIRRVP